MAIAIAIAIAMAIAIARKVRMHASSCDHLRCGCAPGAIGIDGADARQDLGSVMV